VQSVREDPDLLGGSLPVGAHEVLREADEWIRGRAGPGSQVWSAICAN